MSPSSTSDGGDFCWVSGLYSEADADVVFQSSDNHHFNLHSQCLDVNSGNMPYANGVTHLPEPASTLELLFGFVYAGRHPELENVDFLTLLRLAEAAEKYEVYNAMNVCKIRMQAVIQSHPLHVLNYAVKHRYLDLSDAAAPSTVGLPESEAVKVLDPTCYISWSLYSSAWRSISREAFILDETLDQDGNVSLVHVGDCSWWSITRTQVLVKMGSYDGCCVKQGLDEVFRIPEHPYDECCLDALKRWRENVEQRVLRAPMFSTFV